MASFVVGVATNLAESAISSAITTLGRLAFEEAKFLLGVPEQIKETQRELELLQSFLRDAEKVQEKSNIVGNLISDIVEAVYDAEDAIETLVLKAASSKDKGLPKRYACICKKGMTLYKVGSEIESIRAKISGYVETLRNQGIKQVYRESSSSTSTIQQQRRPTYPNEEEDVVGFQNNIRTVVEKLVEEETNSRLVSICGMGGLGKTTLAKKVYNAKEIRRSFDAFAWVFVSQQYNPTQVWKNILSQLSPSESTDNIEEIKLVQRLNEVQNDKKCLVVLDDIWTNEAWRDLKDVFPLTNHQSKLLLTSRNNNLPPLIDPRGFVDHLDYLSKEESWELLKMKAPRADEAGFVDPARIIVDKCGGLPLAISVIGGLLATKHTIHEWETVRKCMNRYLRDEDNFSVEKVLALSYHELPYHLKPCFLYLSQYPEDFEISTEELMRMWIAEGFVSLEETERTSQLALEDVAEEYLHKLIDRCMVQVAKLTLNGRVKACRLHDLMRDLSKSIATQANLLNVVDIQSIDSSGSSSSSAKLRRLAINSTNKEAGIPVGDSWYEQNTHLRSFLFFCESGSDITRRQLKPLVNKLRLLRVLKLQFLKIMDVPTGIECLIHLKCLILEQSKDEMTGVIVIPSSVGKLSCLQTLEIVSRGIFLSVISFPDVVWKMKQLKHLRFPKINEFWGKKKFRLGNNSKLMTLEKMDASKCYAKEIAQLTNLRKLALDNVTTKFITELRSTLDNNSSTFPHLHSLSLVGNSDESTREQEDLTGLMLSPSTHSHFPALVKCFVSGKLTGQPSFDQLSSSLTKLTLCGSCLKDDPMPNLEKLPNLQKLRLARKTFEGSKMVCSRQGFPQLKSLSFEAQFQLQIWEVHRGAMPTLSHLVLYYCPSLERIPDELKYITTLRKLEIKEMPNVKCDIQETQDLHIVREDRAPWEESDAED